MEKDIKFAVEDIKKIQLADYDDDEFAIAKMGFLSTRPNSHELKISENVLRESASSVLGKWVVAYIDKFTGDATTHVPEEKIVGRIPRSQDVEFVYDDDGYLRAYVDTVISKIYAKDYCTIFEKDNNRAVSVEMKCLTDENDDNLVTSFKIVGVTTLGKTTLPSCPQSDIEFVRFSEEGAETFFNKIKNKNLTNLEKFMKEREVLMGKTYKVDKSKEAISNSDWGDVDKASQRDKIMEADNRDTLVKAVYALVEDGWQDAPSEYLKYPLMELKGDTFVYNRGALSSALAYAKQHNETAVINKVEKIYKKLDLDDSDGKEEKKMSEIEFAAVDIGDLWCRLYDAMRDAHEWDFGIHGIYEEGNQKFVIVVDRDRKLYRLDFSLTEEGITLADEIIEVKEEFVETENMQKFAEPENVANYRKFEEKEKEPESSEDNEDEDKEEDVKMSEDEMMAKIAELEQQIEEKENIIMGKDNDIALKDTELEQLRQFKADIEAKEQAMAVESILNSMTKFMDKETTENFRKEGLAVEFAQLDAWANKVKASVVDKVVKTDTSDGIFSFSAPVEKTKKQSNNVWERLG